MALASFTAGGAKTLYTAADSRWGATGSLLEGDVNLSADSKIVRVMVPNRNGSLLRLNDHGPLVLRAYFGVSGAGVDLTVWVQTDSGTTSFAANDVETVGGGYVNFNVPTTGRAILTRIGAGDRFVLALTRPTPAPTAQPVTTPVIEPATEPVTPPVTDPITPSETEPETTPDTVPLSSGRSGQSRSEPAAGDLPGTGDTTGVVALDQAARGRLTESTALWDTDWFAADLTAGHAYRIQVLGTPGVDCTLLAPIVESVHDASGAVVAGTEWSDESREQWSRLTFTPAAA